MVVGAQPVEGGVGAEADHVDRGLRHRLTGALAPVADLADHEDLGGGCRPGPGPAAPRRGRWGGRRTRPRRIGSSRGRRRRAPWRRRWDRPPAPTGCRCSRSRGRWPRPSIPCARSPGTASEPLPPLGIFPGHGSAIRRPRPPPPGRRARLESNAAPRAAPRRRPPPREGLPPALGRRRQLRRPAPAPGAGGARDHRLLPEGLARGRGPHLRRRLPLGGGPALRARHLRGRRGRPSGSCPSRRSTASASSSRSWPSCAAAAPRVRTSSATGG